MNAVEIAYRGKLDMLRACYGGGKSSGGSRPPARTPASGTSEQELTPRLFDAMFDPRRGSLPQPGAKTGAQ